MENIEFYPETTTHILNKCLTEYQAICRGKLNEKEMSNFTAGVVRVEADLPETATVIAKLHSKNKFKFENECPSDGAQYPRWCTVSAMVTGMPK